jgi:hydroxymethylbilane synthase
MTTHFTMTPQKPLRIGTRASPLAMVQAQMAAAAISAYYGLDTDCVNLMPMQASGDVIQDRPLAEIGGKALWTKELERALLEGDIDIAVHSMKDVETIRPPEFTVAAMLPRADVRDRLIGAVSIAAIPPGANIGTSSPRRAAQIKSLRPDVTAASIRGNVATRIGKIDGGEFDATLLAAAGLDRLGMHDKGTAIEITDMLPAASQGAVGIETLSSRRDVCAMLMAVNDTATFDCVMAERAFLAALGGTCHSPVAALAVMDGTQIFLRGEILTEDGSEKSAGHIRFDVSEKKAPANLAYALLDRSSSALKQLFGF